MLTQPGEISWLGREGCGVPGSVPGCAYARQPAKSRRWNPWAGTHLLEGRNCLMDEELTQLNLKLFRKWKLEADLEWVKSWPPLYWPPEWRGENFLTRKHLLAELPWINSFRGYDS